MSAKLTDAETDAMARSWWAQHDKPLEPILSFPLPLVPFNELPAAGEGAIIAGAIRSRLAEDGYDGSLFIEERDGGRCLNCNERKPEVGQNNGHCDECLARLPLYPYSSEQLADCSVVGLNMENPDVEDLLTPDAVYELVCKAARHGRKHLDVSGR